MKRDAISWRVRGLVMARAYLDGRFICNWCCARLTADEVVIDHYQAVALGGSNEPDNLVVSCRTCNQMKGSLPAHHAEAHINAALELAALMKKGRRRG